MVQVGKSDSYPPVFIGCDPGKKGGIVTLQGNGKMVNVDYTVMPSTTNQLWDWFRQRQAMFERCPTFAVLEQVSTSPQMGVVSAGTFMFGYGQLQMALVAAKVPFQLVRPQVWQQSFSIAKRKKKETDTKWKRRLGECARRLFPSLPLWDCNYNEIDAVADALLISEFCRRTHYESLKNA